MTRLNLTKPRLIALATGAALATAASTAVLASGDENAAPIDKADEITALLTADGYAVEDMEREGDLIEVEAIKDGQEWEIYLNPESLEIVKTELDD